MSFHLPSNFSASSKENSEELLHLLRRCIDPKVADVFCYSYNVTSQDLFDLFGKFGSIRQIRQGTANNTKGTAFVVYDDVTDAKQACDKLNGFNFQNRYLVGKFI